MSGCWQYICDGASCQCDYWFELKISAIAIIIIFAVVGILVAANIIRGWRKR